MNTPLKVTATLATNLAVSEDFSPSLESLLFLRTLETHAPHLVSSNPGPEEARIATTEVAKYFPLEAKDIFDCRFYLCSAPFYSYTFEDVKRIRKRWDYQDKHLNWGKKKARFSSSEGFTKAYDIPLYTRNPKEITWYVVGNKSKVLELLEPVNYLGKKRSVGNGVIIRWDVVEISKDYSLIKDGLLSAVIPVSVGKHLQLKPEQYLGTLKWGWRSPVWLGENQTLCYLPKNNVVRIYAKRSLLPV